jgi:hypothetical protein
VTRSPAQLTRQKATREALTEQLRRSLEFNRSQEMDVPAEAAVRKAEALLNGLVVGPGEGCAIEVFVADDGTIEITASLPDRRVTIDISPATSRTAVVTQRTDGTVIHSNARAEDPEVMRQLEPAG